MERKTYPAPIDGKNVTTDWIEDIFDMADFTRDGKCMVGFVSHYPVLVAWSDNYIVWQAVLGGENCLDVLEKRLALFEDEESDIYSERKRVANNLILQSFYFKEDEE